MNATSGQYSNYGEGRIDGYQFSTEPIYYSPKNERKILKAFLLGRLRALLLELFENEISHYQNNYLMEHYTMDNKIIQLLIQGIIETGEYTLEGIAYHTRIPFDVIYDATLGFCNQFSVTFWAALVNLYMQVKPDIAKLLVDKLIKLRDKNAATLLSLLKE